MKLAISAIALFLIGVVCASQSIKVHTSHKETGIVYEAENAFANVKHEKKMCNLGGVKPSGGSVAEIDDGTYVTFTVNIPEDGTYPVFLSAYVCAAEASSLDVYVNGISCVVGKTLLLDESNMTVHDLPLREGLNTIRYHVYGGMMAFDYISVKGGAALAARGATIAYQEIEAEDASYQGNLIGPDRTYTRLPSEASGRKAVQLAKQGDYVEFSPTQSFNALVVRFSIPNSNDGNGQAANLNVLINGQQVTVLNVTSYYSWTYGEYPFYRNPGAGNPHHFYDDVRVLLNKTYNSGTKVRVVGASSVIYTIDLADFYSVPAPYSKPSGYISVTDYGADPTGKQDSGGPFQVAFNDYGNKKAAGLWIPAGVYKFSYRLNLRDGFIIRGAGPWYTELTGHDFGFDGQGCHNCGVYDFAVLGSTNVRNDGEVSSGVGTSLNNAIIQNLWIERNKCGLWLDGPFTALHVTGLTIRNTFADGINFHNGVTNSLVEQTIVRNTGDDSLAMWAQGNYDGNTFKFNTLTIPVLANTIAIYGGSNNQATDNYCADTVIEGAGLQTGTRFGSTQMSGKTYFGRNTLVRCGSGDMYNPSIHVEGAIWLYADNNTPINSEIVFEDITIDDSYFQAIEFFQGEVSNLNLTNIKVTGAKYLFDTLVNAAFYAQGIVAKNVTTSINNCGNKSLKITQGSGNSGWSTTDVKCEQ